MDIPIFFDEIPKENINKELLKRNGETVLLADNGRFTKSYFLCRIKIDPKDKNSYFVQMPLGDSKNEAHELKLDYDDLVGLKVRTIGGPILISKKYKLIRE